MNKLILIVVALVLVACTSKEDAREAASKEFLCKEFNIPEDECQ